MSSFSIQALYNLLIQLTPHRQFFIAYSGGLDSHVLLHAMAQLRSLYSEFKLYAVHIHHGLSPQADKWWVHCERVCRQLQIAIQCHRVALNIESGESIEALARSARYQAFSAILPANACMLTAHTQSDQAETLLLQLLRGAGLPGLAAMPVQRKLGEGYLLRPLLSFTRQQLEVYVKQHKLCWIMDESNEHLKFDRNYLRHQMRPVLQQRWPAWARSLSRAARHCAEGKDLLIELAQQDLSSVWGAEKNSVRIAPLAMLSPARQRNVLRYWIQSQGFLVPQARQLQQIQQQVSETVHGAAQMQIKWGNAVIRRHKAQLLLLPASPSVMLLKKQDLPCLSLSLPWDLKTSLVLPQNLGELSVESKKGMGLSAKLDRHLLQVRFRRGGERCHLPGRRHTHSLKKLLQAWQIPFWQRNSIPLLYSGDQLAAVVGYCVCEGFAAAVDEDGLIISHSR